MSEFDFSEAGVRLGNLSGSIMACMHGMPLHHTIDTMHGISGSDPAINDKFYEERRKADTEVRQRTDRFLAAMTAAFHEVIDYSDFLKGLEHTNCKEWNEMLVAKAKADVQDDCGNEANVQECCGDYQEDD